MFVLILISALYGGHGEGNNLHGTNTSTAAFRNLASCQSALAAVVAETDGAVDGICVPQKVKKPKKG